MRETKFTLQQLLDWCDKKAAEGKQLDIVWDGGGDSGWVYFEIDGTTVENQYADALVDYINDELDYGSWAGEFTASGKAVYDPTTKQFEGTDYYSEDENEVLDTDIKLVLPKSLWFDTVHVEVECHQEESCRINVSALVKNGFLTPKHSEICSNLEKELQDEFDNIIENYEDPDHDFRYCGDSWVLDRSEGVSLGDDLIFSITKVEISVSSISEKQIVLDFTDENVLEHINNRLSLEDGE
jgi:hypothetical protein